MTREEALKIWLPVIRLGVETLSECKAALDMAIKALEQESCKMTTEEYRQRMIDAFHNADCDNLIALVALPSEKEFEHLEWLLKNHYHKPKQQPCEDCISREAVLETIETCNNDGLKGIFCSYNDGKRFEAYIKDLPSVTPKEKTGHWIDEEVGFDGDIAYRCSNCNELFWLEEGTPKDNEYNFCPNCGARMVSE